MGDRHHVRFNDGAVDPPGRFIVGPLSTGEPTGSEQLLRISPDGTVEVLRSEVQLSNKIAWSPDGRNGYHVDTLAARRAFIVYHLSQFLTLEPGDLIKTGTPAGVGPARSRRCYATVARR